MSDSSVNNALLAASLFTGAVLYVSYCHGDKSEKSSNYFQVVDPEKHLTGGYFENLERLKTFFPEFEATLPKNSIVIHTELFEAGYDVLNEEKSIGIPRGYDLVKDALSFCSAAESARQAGNIEEFNRLVSRALNTSISGNENFSATPYKDGQAHSIGFGFYCIDKFNQRKIWNETLGKNAPDFDKAIKGDKSVVITPEQAAALRNAKIEEFKEIFYTQCGKYNINPEKLPANILTCCISQIYQNPNHLIETTEAGDIDKFYGNLKILTANPNNTNAREAVINHMVNYLCLRNDGNLAKSDGLVKRALIIANIGLHNTAEEVEEKPIALNGQGLFYKIEGVLINSQVKSPPKNPLRIFVIGENPLSPYFQPQNIQDSTLINSFRNIGINNFELVFSDGCCLKNVKGLYFLSNNSTPSTKLQEGDPPTKQNPRKELPPPKPISK